MRVLLIIAVAILAFRDNNPGRAVRYRSDILEEMARALRITERLDTLQDGCHDEICFFEGIPVSAVKEYGVVEHIGFDCFSSGEETLLGEIPCRFLERYTLECRLPLKHEKSLVAKMYEDGVIFEKGDLWMLARHGMDSVRYCRVDLVGERRYVVTWTMEGGKEGSVVFPADHELLFGRNMEENDRRLPEELTLSTPVLQPVLFPGCNNLRDDGVVVEDQGSYYLPSLRSVRYWWPDGQPVADREHPLESLANLLCGVNATGRVDIMYKMRIYPIKNICFQGTLDGLLRYAQRNNLTIYWGVTGFDAEQVTGLLLLRNPAMACNHLLRIQAPLSVLSGEGVIRARLTPFIPTHNLLYLFEESAL